MSDDLSVSKPEDYGLEAFKDLLPGHAAIAGEVPGAFDGFYAAMWASLAPATPYECVIAESLVAIEWEILQHRQMRDAAIRMFMRQMIRDAVLRAHLAESGGSAESSLGLDETIGGGGMKLITPAGFDEAAARAAGEDLAERAMSPNPAIQHAAYGEIEALGLAPVDLMARAYSEGQDAWRVHESRIQDLERRRIDAKKVYDALLKDRPVDVSVSAGAVEIS